MFFIFGTAQQFQDERCPGSHRVYLGPLCTLTTRWCLISQFVYKQRFSSQDAQLFKPMYLSAVPRLSSSSSTRKAIRHEMSLNLFRVAAPLSTYILCFSLVPPRFIHQRRGNGQYTSVCAVRVLPSKWYIKEVPVST